MVAAVDDEGAAIAGYPLVRAVRRDAEREVWVAADAAGGGVELHRGLAGAEAAVAREAEALLACPHPHLVPILDVAVDEGPVLVRPLLQRDLADWLVRRQAPSPGEAVTALAPIAAALGALHASGASAGGCAAGDVRLDPDGAPLLLGAGARVEAARPTQAWRESSSGVAADAAGWRQLAVGVLEACGVGLPGPVEVALERRDLAAAGDALLACWPALPIELEAPVTQAQAPAVRMRERARAVGVEAVWARLALAVERLVERGGPATARAAAAAAEVRPRFWAIAGGGAAALVVAAVLLAQTGAAAADPVDAAPRQSPAAGAAEASPRPSPSAEVAAAASAPPPGDDPETAIAALLAEREACIDAADAACLVALHEPQSPQLDAAEPWRMPDDGTVELVQRLGDAWLVRVVSERAPASVLVMSTEAGWTLRDAWAD